MQKPFFEHKNNKSHVSSAGWELDWLHESAFVHLNLTFVPLNLTWDPNCQRRQTKPFIPILSLTVWPHIIVFVSTFLCLKWLYNLYLERFLVLIRKHMRQWNLYVSYNNVIKKNWLELGPTVNCQGTAKPWYTTTSTSTSS